VRKPLDRSSFLRIAGTSLSIGALYSAFATGEHGVICDHYCGLGHGSMKMTLTVVQ
jgi:heme/copper-type cytochrome/quinol oxidase subunit 2